MAPHCVKNPRAYQYPIGARNFVKVGRPNLLISTLSFGYAVENMGVVMLDVVAKKHIGNQFQECRLSIVGPSNKKDSVGRVCLVFQRPRDQTLKVVQREGTHIISEYEGNVPDESFGEEGG